ncbi:barrier-to-autointegration factor-like [Saccostrea cucullata]|uniref:barrier-to-autointegration factor-like n=1 Tax=Saccostrea cuccullata TaxID=36930 RepID=UPI002ED41CEE
MKQNIFKRCIAYNIHKSVNSTSKKYIIFINESMAFKPVTAIPGVGPVYGRRLAEKGFSLAPQVYGKYLQKNEAEFKLWFQEICGASAKTQIDCCRAFHEWSDNFL